jgi:hypothetical protein
MNTYLLAYDPLAGNFSITQLFAFVKENKKLDQYYTPFAGCYILKSSFAMNELQRSFASFFEGSQFVISPIEPSQTGGALPKEIWLWVNSGQLPSIDSKL